MFLYVVWAILHDTIKNFDIRDKALKYTRLAGQGLWFPGYPPGSVPVGTLPGYMPVLAQNSYEHLLLIFHTALIMFPSVPIITSLYGMIFFALSMAVLTACTIPPQQGTSIRVTVTLRISFAVKISVSFSM